MSSQFVFTREFHSGGTRVARQVHAEPILEIVVTGTVVETVLGKCYQLKPGMALFKPAMLPRKIVCVDDAQCLLIQVPSSLAPDGVVAERTGRAWAFNLVRECERREPGWELVVEGLTLQGLGHLRRERSLSSSRPGWLDTVVNLARQYRPLAEIASIVGKHPSHLAREFRRHEGVSVGEYARRARLELAAMALRRTDDAIASVALAARFCDQSHFTNAFRRVFGVTPAEYRRSGASG